jgi:hypothetical protein
MGDRGFAMVGRMTITEKDFGTMLGIVGHPDGVDLADPLPNSILTGLRDLIPCGNVTFAEMDSFCRVISFEQEVGDPGLAGPEREAWDAAYWTHYWNTPACHYPESTGDLDTVTHAVGLSRRSRAARDADVPRLFPGGRRRAAAHHVSSRPVGQRAAADVLPRQRT